MGALTETIEFGKTGLHKTANDCVSKADGAASSTATSITVEDATNNQTWPTADFAVYNKATGEIFYVTSRSGNTLTLDSSDDRGFGGTTAAAITDGDELRQVHPSEPLQVISDAVNDLSNLFHSPGDGRLKWDETNKRLGIGKVPSTTLDVDGTVTATSFSGDGSNLSGVQFGTAGNSASGTLSLVADDDDSGGGYIALKIFNTEHAVLSNDGNFGIGTSTPEFVLHVDGGANGQIMSEGTATARYLWKESTESQTAGGLWRAILTGTDLLYELNTAAGEDFSSRTTVLALNKDGNVGVGQTSFGTSAAGVWALGEGTRPTTSPADAVQLWVEDLFGSGAAGSLHGRNEQGNQWAIGAAGAANNNMTLQVNETVDNLVRFQGTTNIGSVSSLELIGRVEMRVTQADPSALKSEMRLSVNNGDSLEEVLRLDDTPRVDFRKGSVALGGGSSATLGTIGGSGPTTAGQDKWLEIKIAGTTHWVPAWT